jgi:hemolysin activation/secretion protein
MSWFFMFQIKVSSYFFWFCVNFLFLMGSAFKNKFLNLCCVLIVVWPIAASAGFIEMPETTEAQQFERKSLLTDLDIPAVKDRDPDPQSGPRLNVKEFRIQGLVEFPEQGITRELIIKQVEAIRFDMMGEGKLLGSGYTLDELGQVSDLIVDIEKETEDEHVGPLEVQKLVFLIREQRRQRGITLGMVETVANTITRYYREHGFILAKAYIPKQQVREGVVTLTVLLGELGEVTVQNNKRYSAKTIQNVFKSDLAKPVTNDLIEENLYLINDLPGLSVQGYFEPGSQVGDTKLNVNVTAEKWYDSNVRLDNNGSELTGKYRVYTDFLLHNPLTIGDEIELGVLGTFAPQNSVYGSLRYNIPIVSPKLKFSTGVSSNDFVTVESSGTDVSGESKVIDASLKYQFKRSRVKNYALGLKVSRIESQVGVDSTDVGYLHDVLLNTELFFEIDLLNEKKRTLHQGNIAIISSQFSEGVAEGREVSPAILAIDYSRLSFVDLPFTDVEPRLVLKFSGQYAGTALASSNQYSLGGASRMRGFVVNEYYAEDAVYVGADLVFKGLGFNDFKIAGERIADVIQPFVFADGGYGKTYGFLTGISDTEAKLVDVGLGLKINYRDSIRGNLIFAFPLLSENDFFSGGENSDKSMNIYFDMQYGF